MVIFNDVLARILEICGVAVILTGAFMWLKTAIQARSTARSFMALVFTFTFFLVVVLRNSEFEETTLRWITVVYGGVIAFYILARMIEHREHIKGSREEEEVDVSDKSSSPSILMDELESDPSIDTRNLDIHVRKKSFFRKRKAIQISGSVASEEAKEKITRIAEKHTGEDYFVINDLVVE